MSRKLARLEVWTNLEADSGTMLAVINDWISAFDTREVGGKEILRVELRRETANWSSLQERRVLRAVFSDGTWDEWRIAKIVQLRTSQNTLIGRVECESPRLDLMTTQVRRTEADGQTFGYFELYGLTPSDHMGVILSDAPAYFSKGSIDSTIDADMVYDWDNPLSAISELAAITDTEIDITAGSTTYTVGLSTRLGSTADVLGFRYAKNMMGVQREAETQSAFASRVFPRGGGAVGERLSIADALWLAPTVDVLFGSATQGLVTLSTIDGDAIAFDNQFDGLYLHWPFGAERLWRIETSNATSQTLVVNPTTRGAIATLPIIINQRVGIRELGPLGNLSPPAKILWLGEPTAEATYGEVARVVDRPDIPRVDNLMRNGFLDGWLGFHSTIHPAPDFWNRTTGGSVTIGESTGALNRRYGASSARIIANSSGRGIFTDSIVIDPTTVSPFFTGQIALKVTRGAVKLELIDESSTQGGVYPPEGSEPAITTVINTWVESLGIGGIDLNEVGSTSVRLRITAYSTGGADWYLDAAQLTQTAGGAEVFYPKRASNALWLAGNTYLFNNSAPRVAFNVDVLDLERQHPDVFPTDKLIVGGTVRVTDSDLDLDFQTRAIEIVRDLDKPGASRVRLSNRPEDLTGLGVPGRRPKSVRPQIVPKFRRPSLEVGRDTTASSTKVTFDMLARTDGQLVALFHKSYNTTGSSTGAFTRSPAGVTWKESGFSAQVDITRPIKGAPTKNFEAYALDRRGARSGKYLTIIDESPRADVFGLSARVNENDGSVELDFKCDVDARWIRFAQDVDYPAAISGYPAEGALASATTVNGRLVQLAASSTQLVNLSANTVDIGQQYVVLGAAYLSKTAGSTSHGNMKTATDFRGEVEAILLDNGWSEGTSGGRHNVKVIDPLNSTGPGAQTLYRRTRTSTGLETSWSKVDSRSTGSLANNSTYAHIVTTAEKRQSFIDWRLVHNTSAESGKEFLLSSPGFDEGKVPDVAVTATVHSNGKVDASWQGDADTFSIKVIAKSTGNPTKAAIRAATAEDGRVGTSTGLITLTVGQTAFVGLYGYGTTGGGGTESSTAFFTKAAFATGARLFGAGIVAFSSGGVGNTEFTASWSQEGLSSTNRFSVKYFKEGVLRGQRTGLAVSAVNATFLDTENSSPTALHWATIVAIDGAGGGGAIVNIETNSLIAAN